MRIHFIGIGGIGVSALAQYYLAKGHQVSGSDLVASEITDLVKNKGAEVFIGHNADNLPANTNLVICSPAVSKDNAEYIKAKELGIKLQTYPEALGELTKQYNTIAVAGAHGKSTTTVMIALALMQKNDPTVVVGTLVKEFGNSNFRMGKSNWLVIEACEYDGSFLNYWPKIAVVTNVDKEHLDYFKNFKNVIKAFKDFILRLPENGVLVANKDDKHIPKAAVKTINYSLKSEDAKKLKEILKVPGQHNLYNALAALSAARAAGANDGDILEALSKYQGSWRRFEVKEGTAGNKKITVVSDYGHHPNEVAAALNAAREKYPDKTIWCVFQPHQYQRTYYLFDDFIKMFRKAPIDRIILTDIYDVAGRETQKISGQVSAEKLAEKIKKENVAYISLCDIEAKIKQSISQGDVLIIMGAGDIYKLAEKFA